MSNIKYTLEQCEEAMQQNKTVYYSAGTLWWTDDENDLEEAKKLGMAAQDARLNKVLNDPNVPEVEKERIKSLRAMIRKDDGGYSGPPLDPFASPLYMIDTKVWIDKAKENVHKFGKYGIEALMQTHHKNKPAVEMGPFLNYQEVTEFLDGYHSAQSMNSAIMKGVDMTGNTSTDKPAEDV